jgi:hypothetical protein
MGRVLIFLAAVVSLAMFLAVLLAPDAPPPTAMAAPAREPLEQPAPPLLKGCAPEPVEPAVEPKPDTVLEEVTEDDGALRRIDPKDAPPDPIQTGNCTLVLEFSSDVDRTPLTTTFELWRIDEPGNEHWTAGDRRIQTLKAEDGKATVHDLAAGRYRVHAYGQRAKSEDAEPFAVSGDETIVALALPAPRLFQVRLRVYDQAGRLVLRGHKQSGGASSYSRSGDRTPSWVKQRTLRDGILDRGMSLGGGCGSGGHRGRKIPIDALDGTFGMLTMRESERRRSWSRTWYLHPEDGTRVSLFARSDTARDRVFVGVTVPLAELHDVIRLPDGSRAIDAGAYIRASCPAVLVKADGVEPDWRNLPIEVRVSLKGYADLKFEHTLAGPLVDRTLVPNME